MAGGKSSPGSSHSSKDTMIVTMFSSLQEHSALLMLFLYTFSRTVPKLFVRKCRFSLDERHEGDGA